jgi:hypothetical protein
MLSAANKELPIPRPTRMQQVDGDIKDRDRLEEVRAIETESVPSVGRHEHCYRAGKQQEDDRYVVRRPVEPEGALLAPAQQVQRNR